MKVYAKKRFGQNFISDSNLIEQIVSLLGNDQDALVIEIGPGMGALTVKLVEKFKKVIGIEIDHDLVSILKEKIIASNFEIINQDVLTINFSNLIKKNKEKESQNVYLISNLPYYITSEILFKTLSSSQFLNKAIFMMQKEVAQRICAHKNENNYNNLSVAVEFYATRKYEFTVKKNKFNPVPKVDSAIVSLTFNQNYWRQVENDEQFIQFVRNLFSNRRKTILNNLTNLTKNKLESQKMLDLIKIDFQLRPENLGIDDFIALFNLWFKKSKII